MLAYWRAGAGALRAPLVVGMCLLCFVVGSLMATPTDQPAPPMVTQPTAAVTDESVRALAEALAAVTASSVPSSASSVVEEAQEVLDAVESGQVQVTPSPTATTTTTTTVPTTTTSTTAPAEVPLEWPSSLPSVTVPPPFTVTVP